MRTKTFTPPHMEIIYIEPVTRITALHYEQSLLYSGLKDMPDNPIYPSEELDDDNN